jgi:hypothetical protein
MPSTCAAAIPVMAFVIPGPLVVMTSAGFPVTSVCPIALNADIASCRV